MTVMATKTDYHCSAPHLADIGKPLTVGLEEAGDYHRTRVNSLLSAGFALHLVSICCSGADLGGAGQWLGKELPLGCSDDPARASVPRDREGSFDPQLESTMLWSRTVRQFDRPPYDLRLCDSTRVDPRLVWHSACALETR